MIQERIKEREDRIQAKKDAEENAAEMALKVLEGSQE